MLADTGQLKQVVLNLAINALHAMEGRENSALTIEVQTGSDQIVLVVDDNGPGIAPENLGRIFDPFFTTKGADRGTGLGLSICFSIVRQFGGEIRVESQLGAGARFLVTLPVAPETAGRPPADDPAEPGPLTKSPSARTARVLVIDDEEFVRRAVQEALRTQFDCRVDLATNGAEGLAAVARSDYTLVLSDIRMPLMSGTALYERLLAAHPEITRRFVFITGHPGGFELESQIAAWGVPVIGKPFSLAQLAEVCRPFLAGANRV